MEKKQNIIIRIGKAVFRVVSKVYNYGANNIARVLLIAANVAALTPTKKDDKAVALAQSIYDRLTKKKAD